MWTVRYGPQIPKDLKRLDRSVRTRILDYLDEVAELPDPHQRGKALTGKLSGLWRYRVGDYRVVADIDGDQMVILAINIAHRSHVYDGQ